MKKKKKTLTSAVDEGGSLVLRRGAWTQEEDNLLRKCICKYGEGKWHLVPLRAGLKRCRKSCRLRWLNYLRPHIKRGDFESDEVDLILRIHNLLGNRRGRRVIAGADEDGWKAAARRIPGRTANDVKNYWNTHLRKKLAVALPADQAEPEDKLMKKQIIRTEISVLRPRPTYARNPITSFAHENNLSNTIINPLTTLILPQLEDPNYPNKRKVSELVARLDQSKPSTAFLKNQSSSSQSVDHHHDHIEEFQRLENLMFNDESESSHEAAAASAWTFRGSEEKTLTDIWSDGSITQMPLMDGDFQEAQIGLGDFHVDHENMTTMEDMGNSFWL